VLEHEYIVDFDALSKTGERALRDLPTIEEVFQFFDTPTWQEQLRQRRLLLKEGMLSEDSIGRLCASARAMGVNGFEHRALTHPPSFSASAKQAILPANVFVQKTVSVKIGMKHILCTGIGDWNTSKALKKMIVSTLDLPLKSVRDFSLNPTSINPIVHLGMWPGMVSPFLKTKLPHTLEAIIILTPQHYDDEQQFSVSLSLYESLLLPVAHFTELIRAFLSETQPHLRVVEISDNAISA